MENNKDKKSINAYFDNFVKREELDPIKLVLNRILEEVANRRSDDFLSKYVPESQVRTNLKFSRKYLYNLRRKGILGSYCLGRKTFYSKAEIDLLMQNNYVKNNNK
jgi:hypothetical protein